MARTKVTNYQLYDPIKFSAYKNSSASVANGTIVYETKQYDTGSNYNATTGIFTAPVAGFYFFEASFSVNTTTMTRAVFFLVKNGTEYKRGLDASYTVQYGGAVATSMQLAAADTINISISVVTGSATYNNVPVTLNSFSGFLISTT